MRICCPYCGPRDLREFTVRGAALSRPETGEWGADWHAYLNLRDNPEGETAELWLHNPCGAWLSVRRDTKSHAVISATPAREGA